MNNNFWIEIWSLIHLFKTSTTKLCLRFSKNCIIILILKSLKIKNSNSLIVFEQEEIFNKAKLLFWMIILHKWNVNCLIQEQIIEKQNFIEY
jgi:hypothetical protein